jgi:uncharacterized protein YuzE
MNKVTVKYDPQVDILRLRFGDAVIEESEQVESGIIVDYDESGNVVGVELLDASQLVDKSEVAASKESPYRA